MRSLIHGDDGGCSTHEDIAHGWMFVACVVKRDLESELPRELRLKRFPPSARFTVRKSPVTRTSNGQGDVGGRRFAILAGHLRASA